MEDLCVKMSKLSLQSDSKMDALDAKLEQFFYEEKDEGDEKNEDTFVYNDEAEYSLEVCAFNTRHGTCFGTEKLTIFNEYVERFGLTIDDALQYMQGCHTCGNQLNQFGSEYCNQRCAEYLECGLSKCFHGDSCLICYGYPKTTCYWAYNGCDRCDAYEGLEEDRYPNSCANCLTQMTDHEGYTVDDELYCNLCAVDLFDGPEDPAKFPKECRTSPFEDDYDHNVEDPVTTICYWMPNCPDCIAYSGHWIDRYPYSCFHCDKQMTDHEGYWENSTIHCNVCAETLFGLTGHLDNQEEQHQSDSKKRPRESDDEEITCDQMRDLTDESCDIWELALDINHGNSESALQMIEDQPRLRAHPRVIEYYRAKEASNQDMDFEECSSECSSEDDDLQQRKRARHTHVEDSDEEEIVIDLLDADDEDEIVIDLLDADDEDAMVIDLLSQEDEDEDEENYAGIYNIKRRPWNFPSIGHDSEDDDEEDENYDYAESVVDDDGEVDDNDGWNAMDTSNSVTMSQTAVSSMVTMIQELRDENAALRHELDLIRSQRRMLFPEGSSMSITDEDGQRYINVHPQSSSRGLTMADLDCGNSDDCASDEEDDFEMEEDE
jgi:hypothetical protein